MVKFDLEPAPEEPSKDKHAKKESDASLEKVIEDLRSVLSELNSEKKKLDPEIIPEKIEPAAPSAPLEEIKPEQPINEGVLREPKNPATPSDAEFWSGNVLGWPAEEEHKEPPHHQKPEPVEPEWAEAPTEIPPVAPEDPLIVHHHDEPPLQPPIIETSNPENEEQENVAPFIAGMVFPETTIPPAPEPPFIVAPKIEEAPEEEIPVSPSSIPTGEEIPKFPEPPSPVPIPETVEEKTEDEFLDKAKDLPKGLIQIACIFPQGQEKTGQQFVFKLKIMGSKMNPALTIETVYIQAWNGPDMEPGTWCRAAHLAGATLIFILLPRKDKEVFGKFGTVAGTENMKSRLVFLEQVSARTLYADILDQLKRMAYGKN